AYVKYDGSLYVHAVNNNLRNFSHFNYAAEPFVDQLKNTDDPRGKYIIANFADPGAVAADDNPDTDLANQFGVPIGVTNTQISDPKGPSRGSGARRLSYSRICIFTAAWPAVLELLVAFAQMSHVLADAVHRGWSAGAIQEY